jgi:hypothetical protein
MIKTTKKLSAMRQILSAIRLLDSVDYESAITLGGAAEGQFSRHRLDETSVGLQFIHYAMNELVPRVEFKK